MMPAALSTETGYGRLRIAVWVGIGLLFVGIAMGVILTRSPWWDEGQLADPAHTLAQHGYLGSRIMSGKGHPIIRDFVGYDRYTYWNMPLYLVALAGWIKLTGFSLVSVRLLSVLCGAGLICAGGSLTQRLTGSRLSGTLAALFLATDYTLVLSAVTVRMDIMAAALGFGALAAYAALRETNLRMAALAGGSLAAAACFAHPVGLMHTGGLALLAVFLDRKRLKWTHVAVAAVPYFVFAALWGLYVAQAPAVFLSQFRAATSYRVGGFSEPVRAILGDAKWRYVMYFYPDAPVARLKVGILLVYWAGIVLAALMPRLRRARGVMPLLLLSGLYYVELALLDRQRFPHYMVHVIAMWALLLAAVCGFVFSGRLLPRPLLSTVLGGFILLQISGLGIKIWQDPYHHEYLPAVEFIRAHSSPQSLVMGPSEFQNREPDMERYVSEMLTRRFSLAARFGEFRVYLPVERAER
jgi:4-amino-4-deoxy-L-arabinose transferase-like glycosyltransferase